MLQMIVGNLPIPGAGLAAASVRIGVNSLVSGGIFAYNRYQFKQSLKVLQNELKSGTSVEDLVNDLVASGQYTKEFGDKIQLELAKFNTKAAATDDSDSISELVEKDIEDIEKGLQKQDENAQDEKDKNTPWTIQKMEEVAGILDEGRKKRSVKCKVCGASGVNARSHYNEKSASYGKHDHTNDAAEPKTPVKAPVGASPAKLEKLTTPTPTKKAAVPRCQAINAVGQNAGQQCTAPATASDGMCGRHTR